MNAGELYRAGRLKEAVTAALQDVRKHPTDSGRRLFLSELLCFAGDLERADNQLDALGHGDPQLMPWVVTFRQLIRAEQWRRDFFGQGRLPEFLAQPEAAVEALEASWIRLREGVPRGGRPALLRPRRPALGSSVGDARRRPLPRTCGTSTIGPAASWRSSRRAAATTGSRSKVESIEFHEPSRRAGPVLAADASDRPRMGLTERSTCPRSMPRRATRPTTRSASAARRTEGWMARRPARRRRTFLVGDDAVPILELKQLSFEPLAAR
ncbi:MAG: hypothetical protein U0790_02700 [Isosphaeraceae bacterium]